MLFLLLRALTNTHIWEDINKKKTEFYERKKFTKEGGGLSDFMKPYFFSKPEKAFVCCFCWQDPMNFASVGTKDLGNTGV